MWMDVGGKWVASFSYEFGATYDDGSGDDNETYNHTWDGGDDGDDDDGTKKAKKKMKETPSNVGKKAKKLAKWSCGCVASYSPCNSDAECCSNMCAADGTCSGMPKGGWSPSKKTAVGVGVGVGGGGLAAAMLAVALRRRRGASRKNSGDSVNAPPETTATTPAFVFVPTAQPTAQPADLTEA
jgi:hypothetical protein